MKRFLILKNHLQERGVTASLVVLSLVALLSLTALAVDMGYLMVMRNRMQNAVDAAALRGAESLYPSGWSATPDFTNAVTNAQDAVSLNVAVNSGDTVAATANWWQIINSSAQINPAAVQVTMTKKVPLFFAPIFGLSASTISDTATAVVTTPSSIGAGGTHLPIAITQCLYNQFVSNGAPVNDPSTGQPYVLSVNTTYASYGNSGCNPMQWTPLTSSANQSESETAGVVSNGNGQAVTVGNSIWLQSGDESSLYHDVNGCSSQGGDGSCGYSPVPVINTPCGGSGCSVDVTGLACVNVLSANGSGSGSNGGKTITFQFSDNCQTPNGGGQGAASGVLSPPLLVQ